MGSKKLIAKLTTKLGRAPTADEVAKAKAKKEKKKAKRVSAAAEDTPPPSKKAKTNGKAGTDTAAWRKAHDIKVEPDDGFAPHGTWAEARASIGSRSWPSAKVKAGRVPRLFRLKLGPY